MPQAAPITPAEVADSIAKFFDIDQRPPRGGWLVVIDGIPFDGMSESDVFEKLRVWRANNGSLTTPHAILEEMWAIYRAREPQRHTVTVAMPSFVKRAANLAGAVKRTLVAAVTGQQVVSPMTESDRRETICRQCAYFDPVHRTCLQCGCFVAAKTALAQEHCPIGKW